MRLPLLIKVYIGLRKGWNRLTPEAKVLVREFVKSQERNGEYVNGGGKVDEYYTQFGKVLEAVFSPMKVVMLPAMHLAVKESLDKDTLYGTFFRFIYDEMRFRGSKSVDVERPKTMTTNAVCSILAMSHQRGAMIDEELVKWLKDRQDETGGFYASEMAPVPDLLTTAVALFTLRLIGEKAKSARDFIDAHWMENGGFAPTIFDEYSDVEYVFYGLLALGANE
ncbi:MAG: hypothetical protein KBT33_04080 [Prevotellaceae bacterium]|nr:hypothetical protein [Candidatus Minthosoma equi]